MHNPQLDLVLDRYVEVRKELVWMAWTTPQHLMKWFTPAPWQTVDCSIDLRPGGIFRTVMCSPEGQEFPHAGCYLEVMPEEKLVWTSALLPGYRPASRNGAVPQFTAVLRLSNEGKGTRYVVTLMHGDEAACATHRDMGFEDGWAKALEQLVESVRGL